MLKTLFTIDGIPVDKLKSGSEKKVVLVCDLCGKETITLWHNYIQYQRKNGWTGNSKCQPCAARNTGIRMKGKRNPRILSRNTRTGSASQNWKGGKYIDLHGYVMVLVRHGKRLEGESGWARYKKEHIVLIEEHLGRTLGKSEIVHHINGDKQDNRLENLWVSTHSEHRKAHISLIDIGFQLTQSGVITFDKELGVYIVADIKLRELLEHPEVDNQQPSLSGNALEGSETRG